jgi:hypothetical protein
METNNHKTVKRSKLLSSKVYMISMVFVCSLCSYNGKAQLNSYIIKMDSTTNYYDIKSNMHAYLDSLKTTMDSIAYYKGGGEFKEFKSL